MDYDLMLVVSMKLRTCTGSQISLYSNDFNLFSLFMMQFTSFQFTCSETCHNPD